MSNTCLCYGLLAVLLIYFQASVPHATSTVPSINSTTISTVNATIESSSLSSAKSSSSLSTPSTSTLSHFLNKPSYPSYFLSTTLLSSIGSSAASSKNGMAANAEATQVLLSSDSASVLTTRPSNKSSSPKQTTTVSATPTSRIFTSTASEQNVYSSTNVSKVLSISSSSLASSSSSITSPPTKSYSYEGIEAVAGVCLVLVSILIMAVVAFLAKFERHTERLKRDSSVNAEDGHKMQTSKQPEQPVSIQEVRM